MAVYTKISQQEAREHLKNYQIGELVELKEIVAGIDNSNFILKTTRGKFILTIFEKRIKPNELPFFIDFKLHLAQKGICCPTPILNNQGAALIDLKGKKSAIVSFLSGKTLEPREDGHYNNITTHHCGEIGALLAKMHLAANGFAPHRKNDLSHDGFGALFAKFEKLLDDYQLGLRTEISAAIKFVEANWRADLPTAACHLDLFPDNVFFDENDDVSGVIDFYFAASDLLVYDFASCVNAWCFDEKNNFRQEKFAAMLTAYQNLREFSRDELDFLLKALMSAALRFLLTRLHDMFFTPEDSLVKVKDPQEYLVKMRYFWERVLGGMGV